MPDFDPDAYLRSQAASAGFDPNVYLSSQDATSPPVSRKDTAPSHGDSLARGAIQGATLGWGDEAAAAIDASLPAAVRENLPYWLGGNVTREAAKGATWGERYKNARDYYRQKNEAAKEENPKTYFGGELGGAVASLGGLPKAAISGARGMLTAGGAMGAGASTADTPLGVAGDAATGAAVSLAGGKALQGIAKGAGWLSNKAGERLRAAVAKGTAQAAEDVAAPIAAARGELGAAVQQGSRQVENLMRLEQAMTPEQRALYAQLQEAGIVPELQQRVAQSTLERLPGQASQVAEKQATLQSLLDAAPEAVEKRAAELLSPQEAARQFKARLWRYGPPALGSAIGTAVGGPWGTAVGYLAGAGSRPMVQSLRRMANTPAVQKAIWGTTAKALNWAPKATPELSPQSLAMINAIRERTLMTEPLPAVAENR